MWSRSALAGAHTTWTFALGEQHGGGLMDGAKAVNWSSLGRSANHYQEEETLLPRTEDANYRG